MDGGDAKVGGCEVTLRMEFRRMHSPPVPSPPTRTRSWAGEQRGFQVRLRRVPRLFHLRRYPHLPTLTNLVNTGTVFSS